MINFRVGELREGGREEEEEEEVRQKLISFKL